jgi:Domain of unknown function (DUF4129)
MPASSIPTSDLPWQWRQTQQRLGEWLELQLNQPGKPGAKPNAPWSLQWLAPYITWGLGIALVGLLGFILVRGLRSWQIQRQQRQWRGDPTVTVDAPIVSQQEWLTRSQTYQRQGNFTEAARALYFALLGSLADRQIIPDKRSRTDREYVALTQDLPQPEAFATVLQTHEQIQFAGNALSAQEYDRCQQAYRQASGALATAKPASEAQP